MKKVIVLIVIIIIISLIALFFLRPRAPYKCGCPDCERLGIECNEECEYLTTGKCICYGCVPPPKEYVVDNHNSTNTYNTYIDIHYPSVVLDNKALENLINQDVQNSFYPYKEELSLISEGFKVGGNSENDEMIKNKVFRYVVNYDYYVLDNKYLSLVVNHSINTGAVIGEDDNGQVTDGIRSNRWKHTYVVDVQDAYRNDVLKFTDLCDPSITKDVVVEEIKKQAKEMNIEILLGEGLKTISDTQSFYIDKKTNKMVFCFEPGTISKYNLGSLLFEMPFRYNESTKRFER